jgi:branched-chain amino acid transport system substrate-binding protein
MKKCLLILAVFCLAVGIGGQVSAQVKIGAMFPLTGYAASYGEDAKRGIELAIDQANKAGGIRGKQVEAVFEDTAGAGKTGIAAVRKLITFDKVQVVIDGMMSSVALPAGPICRENKVVFIGTMTSHPDVTSPGGYIYRLSPSDEFSANVSAKFAYNVMKKRRAAALVATTDYGYMFKKLAQKKFESLGGTWLITDEFKEGATDFRTQLTKIKSKNPDVLFIVATHKEAAQLLRQMVELRFKTMVMGTSMLDDPNLIALAGDAAEGVYYDVPAGGSGEGEITKEFQAAFEAKFPGKKPAICAQYFYDATNLAIYAIKEGGESGPEINEAMSKIKGYQGVTGTITFNEIGDRISKVKVKKVENGKLVETGYVDAGD